MTEREEPASASTDQPSEVRTFLIADVRGYSRFTLEHGDEVAARLAARFAEVVEEIVSAGGGRLIELRGDEALAVFASARQALRTAVALQERFARETASDPSLPLTVGIGLDAGEAIPVKGGYRGVALNLAARLQSVARSGEVLASEGVLHLARKTEGIAYLERGEVQVKGFADPVRVVQVIAQDRASLAGPEPAATAVQPETAVPRFEVSILGPFVLRRDGRVLDTHRWQRRVASLFKVIVTAPERRRSRDEIIDLLWPDASPQAGSGNLRLVVHLLRRALSEAAPPESPSPLISQRGWVGLDSTYTWDIDLERFEELLGTAADRIAPLEQAASLYRGTPLSEEQYEDWALPVRERVQRAWRDLCMRLAGLHLDAGRTEPAASWYERALELDPLDEEALRGLLEVLAAAGRSTEAVRRFRRFEHELEQEIGVSPSPETLAMVKELTATLEQPQQVSPPEIEEPVRAALAAVVPRYPLATPGPLRGRQTELETIRAMLPRGNEPAPGPARLVLVAAEAGMGKTRLLGEAARCATDAGMLVLAGGCYEEEGRLPYGPFHDALLDYVQAQPEPLLRSQLGQLLPVLSEIVPEAWGRIPDMPEAASTDPQAQRLRLYSTVAQALQRISKEKAILLLLDDLHWADDPTLQLLHFLVRQAGMQQILLVAAYRIDEVVSGSLLAQLAARADTQDNTTVVALDSLSQDEMIGLLEDRLGATCDPDLAVTLHRRSAGNPFFSVQMMRLLEQEGSLRQEKGHWTLAADARVDLPPAVRDTVARRLRHVTPEVRNTLALGAVLGREFDYVALEAMADASEDALFEALDAAQDARLLRETGSGYAFVHPLLWEVVYGRMPDQRRRRLHDRAGLALEQLYGEESVDRAAELAWHFLESANAPHALRYSLLAAARAERVVAYDEAERYYRAALRLARSLGDRGREAEALEGLGSVLKAVARLDEAVEALEESAQLYRALGDLDAEGRVTAQDALAHYFRGTPEEGLAFVRPVVNRVEQRDGPDHPSHTLATLYAALPRLLGDTSNRFHEELSTAQRAAQLGKAVDDPSLTAAAYLRQGTALSQLGELDRALSAYEEARRLAEPIEDLFTLAAASCFATDIHAERGKLEAALEQADTAFSAAERRGGLEQLPGIFDRTYDTARDVGCWDRAAEYGRRYIALQESLRGEIVHETPLLALGEIALYRGELDEAERYFEQCMDLAPESKKRFRRIRICTMRAESALLAGDPEHALGGLTSILDLRRPSPPEPGPWRLELTRLRLALVDALAAMGRPDEAASFLGQAIDRDWVDRNPPVQVDLLRVQATIAAGRGCGDDAEQFFAEAISRARAMPYPYGEARALYQWGIGTLAADPAAGRSRLEDSLLTFERLRARPYVERARMALGAPPSV